MEIIYKKSGRKYIEVGQYEPEWNHYFPTGYHLIISQPSVKLTRLNVNPDYIGLFSAMEMAREAMCAAMQEADKMKMQSPQRLNAKQKRLLALAELECPLVCRGISYGDLVDIGLRAVLENVKLGVDA